MSRTGTGQEDEVSRAGSFRGSYGRSRNVVKRIALVDTLFHDKNTIREGSEPRELTPDPSALPHSDTNTEKSETTEKSDHTHGETQRSSTDTSDPQTALADFKRSGQNEIESPTNTEDSKSDHFHPQ